MAAVRALAAALGRDDDDSDDDDDESESEQQQQRQRQHRAAEIAASQGLVESVLTDMSVDELKAQAATEGTTPSETALHDLAMQQTQQQLQGLTAAGYLQLDAGQYKATARFEDGKLFVNGQEIPLLPTADAEAGTAEQLLNEEEAAPMTEEPAPAAPAQSKQK